MKTSKWFDAKVKEFRINHDPRVPDCCKDCRRLGSDYNNYQEETTWYCSLCVVFPTRKQTCQRRLKP
jgi:hypothetical protein